MRVRASAVIVENGKLLVLEYDYPRGRVYAIPGGGIHEGETAAEAVCREYNEELGLTVEIGSLRYVAEMMANPHLPQTMHLVFEAVIKAGKPRLDPQHTSAVSFCWLDCAQLHAVGLYPDLSEALCRDMNLTRPPARYLGNSMKREWF